MRTVFFRLLLVFASIIVGASAEELPAKQRPLLWRLQANTTHYVFGTIHLPDPRVTTLPAVVKSAVEQSDIVLTEISMNQDTMVTAAQAMMLPANQSLSQMLSTTTQKAIQLELNRINPALQLSAFDRMKPWAFAASLPVLEVQLRYAGAPALDIMLAQMGKRNEGIETVQEQLNVFDGMTAQQQIRLLEYTLREMQNDRQKGEDTLEALTQTYLSGNETALNDLMNHWITGYDDAADLNKRLLTDRNVVMAQRISERLRKQPSQKLFIAVGAGHLVGESNVVDLLRKNGFQLERVN